MDGSWILIVAVIGAVLLAIMLLLIALGVLVQAVVVAINLFAWAAEYGFIGIALYIILWVVATPVMIAICIIGGVFLALAQWCGPSPEEPPKPGSHDYLDWANRRGKWAHDPRARSKPRVD